jgi:hypothetical protein
MGFVVVFYRDINDDWQEHIWFGYAAQNTNYSFTLPGNQAGAGKTHDWEFHFAYVFPNDDDWSSSDSFGGLSLGNLFGLNATVSVNVGITYRADLYFRRYNIRDPPPPVSTFVYNGNGATGGSVSSTTVTYGTNFTFPGNGFTRTGYTFNQWQLSGNNYNQYYTFVWYGGEGTYTIYATWYQNSYTVTYDGNGSNGGSTSSNTATYDSSFTFQANGFTKTGYDFYKWELYDSGNSFVALYNSGQSYGTWNRLSNHTAKAKWNPKTYTITYIGNGSTGGSTTANTATYDSSFTFQANGFTKTGYDFYKWELYDSGNSFVAAYNSGQSYGIWNRLSNHTAKASWSAISYTVIFNSNGKGTGKTVTQNYGATVTCPILKAVGYVFGGWALSASSTTVHKAGNATFVLGAANQSFFAIWTENTNGSVSFSELQTVYGGTNPIGISEYRTQSGQTTANSQIALSANFKGKGPAP